MGVGKRIVYFK